MSGRIICSTEENYYNEIGLFWVNFPKYGENLWTCSWWVLLYTSIHNIALHHIMLSCPFITINSFQYPFTAHPCRHLIKQTSSVVVWVWLFQLHTLYTACLYDNEESFVIVIVQYHLNLHNWRNAKQKGELYNCLP